MSWSPTNSIGLGFQGYLCSPVCTIKAVDLTTCNSLEVAFADWTILPGPKVDERRNSGFLRGIPSPQPVAAVSASASLDVMKLAVVFGQLLFSHPANS